MEEMLNFLEENKTPYKDTKKYRDCYFSVLQQVAYPSVN